METGGAEVLRSEVLITEVLVKSIATTSMVWGFANLPSREPEVQLHQVASSPPDILNPCSSKSLLRKAGRLEETGSALDS